MHLRPSRTAALAAALVAFAPPLAAQGSGLDFTYGRWWHGDPAVAYGVSLYRPLLGMLDVGFGLSYLNDSRSLIDRSQTGVEVSLAAGRRRAGLYGVASAGLGVTHADRDLSALWSAGAGYALRPVSFLTVGLEARYRAEDRSLRGFWRLESDDRAGVVLQARVAVGFGSRGGGAVPATAREPLNAPPRPAIEDAALRTGASDDVAALAAGIVQTAVDVMGTPYRWGGTGEDGYDCSGLIQYAYQEHGILLPRVSRDQARIGTRVERDLAQLRPGDILTFSAGGGGVSHVGLYVGDGTFIHSASTGVKLSSLTTTDPESRWWQARWVGARRVLN